MVAAGNDNDDACNYSPASAADAITVGSSTINDEASYFSNYGTCNDIYAPGSSIYSVTTVCDQRSVGPYYLLNDFRTFWVGLAYHLKQIQFWYKVRFNSMSSVRLFYAPSGPCSSPLVHASRRTGVRNITTSHRSHQPLPTVQGGGYEEMSGTSMACPHVSGSLTPTNPHQPPPNPTESYHTHARTRSHTRTQSLNIPSPGVAATLLGEQPDMTPEEVDDTLLCYTVANKLDSVESDYWSGGLAFQRPCLILPRHS